MAAALTALFAALPKLLALALAIAELARVARDRNQAMDSIVAQVLQRATDDIQAAAKAEAAADQEHKAHPDDDKGFDSDFRRD